MKIALRILLTLSIFIATYCFVYWVPLSVIPFVNDNILVRNIVSLVVATLIGLLSWKTKGNFPNTEGLVSSVFMGGVITGSIGFILGFFGPMIFTPTANQGPLLGILFTGPLGFVLGLIGGGVYWILKERKKK